MVVKIKNKKLIKVLTGVVGILVLIVLVIYGVNLNQNNEVTDEYKEPVRITASIDDENQKDKDGNYIYENLNDKNPFDYIVYAQDEENKDKDNKCVTELLSNINKRGNYTCDNNGYKYVMVTVGDTQNATSIEMLNFVEDDKEITLRYKINELDIEKTSDRIEHFIFRLPTNKEVKLIDKLGFENIEKYTELMGDYIFVDRIGNERIADGFEMNDSGELTYHGEIVDLENPPKLEKEYPGITLTEYRKNHDLEGNELNENGEITKTIEQIHAEEQRIQEFEAGLIFKEEYDAKKANGEYSEYIINYVESAIANGTLTLKTEEEFLKEAFGEDYDPENSIVIKNGEIVEPTE